VFFNLLSRTWFTATAPNQPAPAQGLPDLTAGCPVTFRRNPRARRYILRLGRNGAATVTIPRGGSLAIAHDFAERHRPWLERELQRLAALPHHSKEWKVGTEILFRGEPLKLEAATDADRQNHAVRDAIRNVIQFGNTLIRVPDASGDLRPAVERHLRNLAAREFPAIVQEYANAHGLSIRRVTIRDQRSRWGSCSRRGTISLNWRLIQTPPSVRDYVILHELMHLREMNHSSRFWQQVKQVCPEYEIARQWLRTHGYLLK
jgi:hypothetical protein